MITLAIDDNNDIFLDASGNVAIVDNAESLRQRLLERLQFFLGEWFLDETLGVPYFQQILQSDVDINIVSNIITNEILKESEVIRVEAPVINTTTAKISQHPVISFDRTTRKFMYSASIVNEFTTFDLTFNF